MQYVRQSLSPGEEIVFIGQFHWIYTFNALLSIFWGFVGCVIVLSVAVYVDASFFHAVFTDMSWLGRVRELPVGVKLGALFILLMGILHFSHMMLIRATTEVAVTSSRIIYKRGLIARYIGEISIDRIEGVNILQTLWGRMFGYGRLLIRGMGVGEVILPPLANPIEFRKAIEKARTV